MRVIPLTSSLPAPFALLPAYFVPLAYGYAVLCVLTVIQRSVLAIMQFRN